MAQRETHCPYCEAEIPLEGNEKEGEEVYCSYCQMKLQLEKIVWGRPLPTSRVGRGPRGWGVIPWIV